MPFQIEPEERSLKYAIIQTTRRPFEVQRVLIFVPMCYDMYPLFSFVLASENFLPKNRFLMHSGDGLVFMIGYSKAICIL